MCYLLIWIDLECFRKQINSLTNTIVFHVFDVILMSESRVSGPFFFVANQVCQGSTMFPPCPQHWLSYPALIIHLLNLCQCCQWHDSRLAVWFYERLRCRFPTHKSKQNLTSSVWQKRTRPRHTSLYSPKRLMPPNTLRIQRLIMIDPKDSKTTFPCSALLQRANFMALC